jgi:predicted nucleotidyltransferase
LAHYILTMNRLEPYTPDIIKLCETHNVKSLYAFGSVLTDNFNKESDIDLIVDFSNIAVEDYADNYFDFKFSLQDILKRPIDLLEEKAIKNPYFRQSVYQKRQLVYGR